MFIIVAEIKKDVCFHKNINLTFIIIVETEKNIIQMRWKCQRANSSAEESECLIMNQSRDLITCCSAKESECLIMSQSESSTMYHLADESECLIMN